MAYTNQYPGREADTIASQIFQHLGVKALPLGMGLTDFSGDTPNPNSAAILTTAVEASQGRRAQTLDRSKTTYNDFSSNAPVVPQKEIKIYPDYYAVGEVDIPELEASLLRDPRYINDAIIPAAFEGCIRQVLKDFYQYLSPHQFIDVGASTATGSGANTGIEAKIRGIQLTDNQLSVANLGDMENLLFNELQPDDTYNFLATAALHNGLATTTVGGGSLNWLNFTGSTEALKNKQYMRIKNFDINRVHFVQGTDSTTSVQKDGILLSDLAPGLETTGASNFTQTRFADGFTPNTYAGQTTTLKVQGTGVWTFKQIPNSAGQDTAVADTQRVSGIAFGKRAMGIAAWSQYTASELIGKNPGNVQTSFVKDPVTGFPFRVLVYFLPENHKYTIEISAWYGFAIADPRAAAFVIRATA